MAEGPGRFCRRLAVVEAMQWTGDAHVLGLVGWLGEEAFRVDLERMVFIIPAEAGAGGSAYEAEVGDWIVKGLKGGLFPCKPENFLQVYERVG